MSLKNLLLLLSISSQPKNLLFVPLLQEKVLKAESEFQERELIKMEREREVAILRRQHEREIYMLKRKLHENSKMQVPGSSSISGRGDGSSNASDPDSLLQVHNEIISCRKCQSDSKRTDSKVG